jgi:hypothetical protein
VIDQASRGSTHSAGPSKRGARTSHFAQKRYEDLLPHAWRRARGFQVYFQAPRPGDGPDAGAQPDGG